jgi:hypothetical protein
MPDATIDELEAFVGPQAPWYFRQWGSPPSYDRYILGFNGAAAIFGLHWLLYRKMYMAAAIFSLFTVFLGALEELVLRGLFGSDSSSYSLAIIILPLYIFPMALLSNRIYLGHCARRIRRIKGRALQHVVTPQQLNQYGGTSWWPIVGFYLFVVIPLVALVLVSQDVVHSGSSEWRSHDNWIRILFGDRTKFASRVKAIVHSGLP